MNQKWKNHKWKLYQIIYVWIKLYFMYLEHSLLLKASFFTFKFSAFAVQISHGIFWNLKYLIALFELSEKKKKTVDGISRPDWPFTTQRQRRSFFFRTYSSRAFENWERYFPHVKYNLVMSPFFSDLGENVSSFV